MTKKYQVLILITQKLRLRSCYSTLIFVEIVANLLIIIELTVNLKFYFNQYPNKMKPDLHKFTGYVQPLTAKAWPGIPIYFKHFKN